MNSYARQEEEEVQEGNAEAGAAGRRAEGQTGVLPQGAGHPSADQVLHYCAARTAVECGQVLAGPEEGTQSAEGERNYRKGDNIKLC